MVNHSTRWFESRPQRARIAAYKQSSSLTVFSSSPSMMASLPLICTFRPFLVISTVKNFALVPAGTATCTCAHGSAGLSNRTHAV